MAILNQAANLTKYDAGGSGDNIIQKGYIKSVEKVWLDTVTISSALTIGSTMTIEIASLPQGSVVTGIEVYGLGSISATSTNAISIGTKMTGYVSGSTTGTITNSTFFLAATTLGTITFNQGFPIMANTNLPYALTNGTNRIFLQFSGASPSITSATIFTKVRYT